MRSLATILFLGVTALGFTIALTGSAAADFRSVPEPMSALVFGAGLVGAAVIARRKKK